VYIHCQIHRIEKRNGIYFVRDELLVHTQESRQAKEGAERRRIGDFLSTFVGLFLPLVSIKRV